MTWVLVALVAVVVLLITFYNRALTDSRNLTSLVIQVLLDEQTYETQKEGLNKLVEGLVARDALDLSTKVQLSVSRFANRIGSSTTLASHGLLWTLKQRGKQ